jgi:hypothetical protein
LYEIYRLVADPEWGEILTIVTIGLLCMSYMSFTWSNAKRLNKRISDFQWAQIYFMGLILFISGSILLGKLIVPANADKLLEILYLDGTLKYLTSKFQSFLLPILRMTF